MTKFEEEVKRPDNGPLTELNNNMQEVFRQYRKMRQYADYLEYELKQKDEHILKVENENSFMRDERTTFDSNGMAVEPIIQQQALPVVKDFVAEWYEEHKEDLEYAIYVFCGEFYRDSGRSTRELTDFESWFDNENYKPIETLICMKDGYTIEKPQLFYLELPKVYGLSNSVFVSKVENGIISEFTKGKDYALAFTEQEIKSIDERYWQFAVPVEDGE